MVEYLEEQVAALEESVDHAAGAWAGRLSRVLVSMNAELDSYAAEEADEGADA